MDHIALQNAAQPDIAHALAQDGFYHLPPPALQDLARWDDDAWAPFAASWHDLGPDRFMADGGRYRLRRHGAFLAQGPAVSRKPHQPHYQSRDYNPLNGGVQRWFDPMADTVADGAVLRAMFAAVTPLLAHMDGRAPDAPWHCEVHQFRIETSLSQMGQPTPEGFHRDGVDWVLVVLITRENVGEGTTRIATLDGQPLGEFTLWSPGDAVLLDDRRIKHGVTPVRPLIDGQRAWRDALVITWTAQDVGTAQD